MSKKGIWWILVVVVAVIIIGVVVSRNNDAAPVVNTETSGALMMKNEITMADQAVGVIVAVPFVALQGNGFVVIHEKAASGAPGMILGASALLPAGSSTNVPIGLSLPLMSGKTYIAMLHLDNGDRSFSEALDPVAKNSAGASVTAEFMASEDEG